MQCASCGEGIAAAFTHFGGVPRTLLGDNAPYRARTKGKTEAGVKYVKRNALADQTLDSFDALEQHLAAWMVLADQRRHGTTREAPIRRFERDERAILRPLPIRALPRRTQRLRRRVALDAFVDVDTIRYSVPHRLVRDHVDVVVEDHVVRIFQGTELVATYARSTEPFARVVDVAHSRACGARHRTAPRRRAGGLGTRSR